MITYKEFGVERLPRVMEIYRAEGWTVYAEPDRVARAFAASAYILGAFEGDTLVGFIRCIGDGEFDVFVTDLIVDADHRRRGIGGRLLTAVFDRYAHIENLTLLTGLEEEANNRFYRAMGMKELKENRLVGYILDRFRAKE